MVNKVPKLITAARAALSSTSVEGVEKVNLGYIPLGQRRWDSNAPPLNGGHLYSMARYKPYDVNQVTLIPESFPDQILSGSFEYALNEIVDEHIDLGPFEARYQNDDTGCLAYAPAILLKIVLFGYYKGLISSRRLAEACERNVQFKALTADTQPHFTTIADFVATMHQEIARVFRDVLIYADALGADRQRDLCH